jgi:hypothetical protein
MSWSASPAMPMLIPTTVEASASVSLVLVRILLLAVHLGQDVDVVQLRSAEVTRIEAAAEVRAATATIHVWWAMAHITSRPAWSTTDSRTRVRVERSIFTLQFRLDALAVRRVPDGRQDRADTFDQLLAVS